MGINIRIRRSIHDTFMKYCALNELTAGQFYEQAGILFMDLNPPEEGALLVVNKPDMEENGFEDRMFNLLYVNELEEFTERLRDITKSGVEIHRSNIKTLLSILKKCSKIKNRSERLNDLMDEAISYFE